MLTVWQTIPDDIDQFICYAPDEESAQDEVDRINTHLAEHGVPSSVSCAYWDWFR